jgi:ATP-dependent helicase/nuclease subunit B
MNLIVSPPGADLIEVVTSRLEGKGKDYSKSLVVFPGKRPAHFLRRALAVKAGSSLIPPVIFSIDEFIDSLCGGQGLVKKLETIDAIALLYDIQIDSKSQMGGSAFITPDSFIPLGLKIYRDLEELMIEGIPAAGLGNVEAFIEEGMPKYTEERLRSLTSFYEEFYRKVDSLGFTTRSKRYRLALDRLHQAELDRFNQIFIAGFFALTDSEKKLFKALLSRDNTLFIFQEGTGLAEKLEDLGLSMEPSEKGLADPQFFFYSSPDCHGEVLALGSELNTLLESGACRAESTVILLPSSETLFPLLRQGLSNLPDDSYNVSLGYPLFRTPVFGFLNSLMELVTSMEGEKIYIPDYLKFLLHPYTKNIYFEGNSEITRILFHTLEKELLKKRSKTFTTIAEIEGNQEMLGEMIKKAAAGERELTENRLREHLKQIHRMTIEKFLSFENISDFARKGIELLLFIFHNSPAKRHPLFLPFSDSLINAFEILSRSLMKEFSFKERSSYFIFLRKYIATCHTPFPGTPLKGLQVLGALETRNLKFKTVFVLDANEEVLPETKKEESLIPFRAREILALPTYIDKDKLTAYYFDILLGGAADVHLFFIENSKKEKSRFVEKLLWEREKKEKSADIRRFIRPIQYRVDLVNKGPASIVKSDEVAAFLKEYAFSATALDRYLKCPLKFYYASVLKLRPKEEISGNIERDELGTFVHLILSSYFSAKMGRPLREDDLHKEEMEKLIETLFEKNYGKDPSGALYLLKRQIKQHLVDFLENYTLPLIREKSVTILACEQKISSNFNGFKLTGQFDRVEQRNEKRVIVDYKTGSNPAYLKIDLNRLDLENREEWSKAIGSLQLPFYILLYSEKEKKPVDELEAIYLLLGRSRIGKEIELPLFNEASAPDLFIPLKTVILKLLQEITDASLPFSPAVDRKRECPGCDYQILCGTQWILK